MAVTCNASLSRRDFINLAAAACLCCISSCAPFDRSSAISDINSELAAALERIPSDDGSDLVQIAREIEANSTQMIQAHAAFIEEFNRLSANRSVSRAELIAVSDRYDTERRSQRDNLLVLQGQLQAAIPEEYWPEVAEILYEKADIVASGTSLEL
ncbi:MULTISPECIES: hypothetical protein [unclassified Ruegeria]|uniref:hypothetical protein n=2 Tax=Ruegeria TaxID=97050 RepID=UPI00147C98B3|nr:MULTISPECIES: hypothetical protein [unclassified Ruegeria]